MTRNAQLGILLTIVGFMAGMMTGYWYWLKTCESVTAAATGHLESALSQLNRRVESSRGPIFPIPLAQADRKEMRDVVQKFTTDLNGNLYMLVPIPTSAEAREVESVEESNSRKSAKASNVSQKEEAAQVSSEQNK